MYGSQQKSLEMIFQLAQGKQFLNLNKNRIKINL